MLDARSDRIHGLILYKPFRVVVCAITLVAFLVTTVAQDFAWAITNNTQYAIRNTQYQVSAPALITIPESLGTIKDSSSGSRVQGQGSMIIHIQDAHCNYYAQKRIAEIIAYLNDKYGVDTINLEGGAKDYDLSIFTSIASKAKRERISDHFVKEGFVNGAEYYAINNPDKVHLWGVEDVKLYIENLRAYRNSLQHKEEIDKDLATLSHILSNLKRHIYSAELLELDMKYGQYKSETLSFKEYVIYLIKMAERRAIDVRKLSNLYFLKQAMAEEENIDFKKANDERDALVDKLGKLLSKVELEKLIEKTVAFKKEEISQDEFYAYLVKKAKFLGLDLAEFSQLKKYIVYMSVYNAVDKSRVMEEMTALEDQIKKQLFTNDDQMALDNLSKNLALTKNLFNISLIKEDYEYYKKNESSFDTRNFVSFIDKKAPLYKIQAKLDNGIGRLDDYREAMGKFYEYSLKRDEAFMKNLKQNKVSVIITGGFHTENLAQLFKKKNISYISIIPNFKTCDGYECPYFKILSGIKDIRLKTAVPMMANSVIPVPTQLNNPTYSAYLAANLPVGPATTPTAAVEQVAPVIEEQPIAPVAVKATPAAEKLQGGIGIITKLLIGAVTLFFANIIGSATLLADEATRGDATQKIAATSGMPWGMMIGVATASVAAIALINIAMKKADNSKRMRNIATTIKNAIESAVDNIRYASKYFNLKDNTDATPFKLHRELKAIIDGEGADAEHYQKVQKLLPLFEDYLDNLKTRIERAPSEEETAKWHYLTDALSDIKNALDARTALTGKTAKPAGQGTSSAAYMMPTTILALSAVLSGYAVIGLAILALPLIWQIMKYRLNQRIARVITPPLVTTPPITEKQALRAEEPIPTDQELIAELAEEDPEIRETLDILQPLGGFGAALELTEYAKSVRSHSIFQTFINADYISSVIKADLYGTFLQQAHVPTANEVRQNQINAKKAELTGVMLSLGQGLKKIRNLIEGKQINMKQLKQVLDLNGGNIAKMFETLNSLSELIEKYGLEDMIKLRSFISTDKNKIIILKAQEDDLAILKKYDSLLLKHGIKPFLVLYHIFPRSAFMGKTFADLMNLLKKHEDLVGVCGMDFICAALQYCCDMVIPKRVDSILLDVTTRAYSYFQGLLNDLNEQGLDNAKKATDPDNTASQLVDVTSEHRKFINEQGWHNVEILTRAGSLAQIQNDLGSLDGVIQKVGLQKIVDFADGHANAIKKLLAMDGKTWAEFLAYCGKIRDDEINLTQHHIEQGRAPTETAAAAFSLDSSRFRNATLINDLIRFEKLDNELNIVEEFLLSKIGFSQAPHDKVMLWLKREKIDGKKSGLVRGLWFISRNGDEYREIGEQLIMNENRKNLSRAMTLVAALDGLVKLHSVSVDEIRAAAATGHFVESISEVLVRAIANLFKFDEALENKIKRGEVHAEALNALQDTDFVTDLVGLGIRYKAESREAYEILRNLVQAYFENGTAGVIKLKMNNDLAAQQDTLNVRAMFEAISKLTVTSGKDIEVRAGDAGAFNVMLENYGNHVRERSFDLTKLTEMCLEESKLIEQEISTLRGQIQNDEFRNAVDSAVSSRDVASLVNLALTGQDNRIRNRMLGLIKRLQALAGAPTLEQAVKIIEKVKETLNMPDDKIEISIRNLAGAVKDSLETLLLELNQIHAFLIKNNKPEAVIVNDMVGILKGLDELSDESRRGPPAGSVTAEVSFNLGDTITIGRHGNSGQGNCQRPDQPGWYNQSLMSFIQDAHELIILIKDNSGAIVGFALLHGAYIMSGDKKEFVYVKERVYTNNNEQTALQEEVAKRLCQKIANLTNVRILDSHSKDAPLQDFAEVHVPESHVKRYLDSFDGETATYGKTVSIKAAAIIPQPVAAAKTAAQERLMLGRSFMPAMHLHEYGPAGVLLTILRLFIPMLSRFVVPPGKKAAPSAAQAGKTEVRLKIEDVPQAVQEKEPISWRRELTDELVELGYARAEADANAKEIAIYNPGNNPYGYTYSDSGANVKTQLDKVKANFDAFIKERKSKAGNEKKIVLYFIGVGSKPNEISQTLDAFYEALVIDNKEDPSEWEVAIYAIDSEQVNIPISPGVSNLKFMETLEAGKGRNLKGSIYPWKMNVLNRDGLRKIREHSQEHYASGPNFVFFRNTFYLTHHYAIRLVSQGLPDDIQSYRDLMNYLALLHIFSVSETGTVLVTEPSADKLSTRTPVVYPGTTGEPRSGIQVIQNPRALQPKAGKTPQETLRDFFEAIRQNAIRASSPAPATAPVDENRSCGTICDSKHEGSYNALDEQLKRQFDTYKQVLKDAGIKTVEELTEGQVDEALIRIMRRLGYHITKKMLDSWRKTVRREALIPDKVKIFFSLPEGGTELFYVDGDYAAGHANQEGTRIHLSLPFMLNVEKHGIVGLKEFTGLDALIGVAEHEKDHIVLKKHIAITESLQEAINTAIKRDKQIMLHDLWMRITTNKRWAKSMEILEAVTLARTIPEMAERVRKPLDIVRAAVYMAQFDTEDTRYMPNLDNLADALKRIRSDIEEAVIQADTYAYGPDEKAELLHFHEYSEKILAELTVGPQRDKFDEAMQHLHQGEVKVAPLLKTGDLLVDGKGVEREVLAIDKNGSMITRTASPDGKSRIRKDAARIDEIYSSYWVGKWPMRVVSAGVVRRNIEKMVEHFAKIREKDFVGHIAAAIAVIDANGEIQAFYPVWNRADQAGYRGEIAKIENALQGRRYHRISFGLDRDRKIVFNNVGERIAGLSTLDSREARENTLYAAQEYNKGLTAAKPVKAASETGKIERGGPRGDSGGLLNDIIIEAMDAYNRGDHVTARAKAQEALDLFKEYDTRGEAFLREFDNREHGTATSDFSETERDKAQDVLERAQIALAADVRQEAIKKTIVTDTAEAQKMVMALKAELEKEAEIAARKAGARELSKREEQYKFGSARIPASIDMTNCSVFRSGQLEIAIFSAPKQWDFKDIEYTADGECYLFSITDVNTQEMVGHGSFYRPYDDASGVARFRYGIHERFRGASDHYGTVALAFIGAIANSGGLFNANINKLRWDKAAGDDLDFRNERESMPNFLVKHGAAYTSDGNLELNIAATGTAAPVAPVASVTEGRLNAILNNIAKEHPGLGGQIAELRAKLQALTTYEMDFIVKSRPTFTSAIENFEKLEAEGPSLLQVSDFVERTIRILSRDIDAALKIYREAPRVRDTKIVIVNEGYSTGVPREAVDSINRAMEFLKTISPDVYNSILENTVIIVITPNKDEAGGMNTFFAGQTRINPSILAFVNHLLETLAHENTHHFDTQHKTFSAGHEGELLEDLEELNAYLGSAELCVRMINYHEQADDLQSMNDAIELYEDNMRNAKSRLKSLSDMQGRGLITSQADINLIKTLQTKFNELRESMKAPAAAVAGTRHAKSINIRNDGEFKYFNPAMLVTNGKLVCLFARRVAKGADTSRWHKSDIVRLMPMDETGTEFEVDENFLIKDAEDPRIVKIGDAYGMTFVRPENEGRNWHSRFVYLKEDGTSARPGEEYRLGNPNVNSKNAYLLQLPGGKVAFFDRASEGTEKPSIQVYMFASLEETLNTPAKYWADNSVEAATILRPEGGISHVGFNTIIGEVLYGGGKAYLALAHIAKAGLTDIAKEYTTAIILLRLNPDTGRLELLGRPVGLPQPEVKQAGDVIGVNYETAAGIITKNGIPVVVSYAGINDSSTDRIDEISLAKMMEIFTNGQEGAAAPAAAKPGSIGTESITRRLIAPAAESPELLRKGYHDFRVGLKRVWDNRYHYHGLQRLIFGFRKISGLYSTIQRMAQGADRTTVHFNEAAGELITADRLLTLAGTDENGKPLGEILCFGALVPRPGQRGQTKEIDFFFLARKGNRIAIESPEGNKFLEPGLYFVEAKEDNKISAEALFNGVEYSQIPVPSANLLRDMGVNVKGIIIAVGGPRMQDQNQLQCSEAWTNTYRISMNYSVEDKPGETAVGEPMLQPLQGLEETLARNKGSAISKDTIEKWKAQFPEFGWHSANPQEPFKQLRTEPKQLKSTAARMGVSSAVSTATVESTVGDWEGIFKQHGVNMDTEATKTLTAYFSAGRLFTQRIQIQQKLLRLRRAGTPKEKAYKELWNWVIKETNTTAAVELVNTLASAAATVPVTRWKLLPNAEGQAVLGGLAPNEQELLASAAAKIFASFKIAEVTAENIPRIIEETITALLTAPGYFQNSKYQELSNNMQKLVDEFKKLWELLRRDRTGRTAWTEVTCYEGRVWVQNRATEEKIELTAGEMAIVIGGATVKKEPEAKAIKKSRPALTEAARKAAPLYRTAKKLIPTVANLMMRGTTTYLIEPAASVADIAPTTGCDRSVAQILSKTGHDIHVSNYAADGDTQAKIIKIVDKMLPSFLKDAQADLKTRMVIRIALKEGEKEQWQSITDAIKWELIKRGVDESVVNGQIRFVNARIEEAEHLNTVIDMFTDLTMAECDRYGKEGQYAEQAPRELAENFKRLLAMSITNFSEFKDMTDIQQILQAIFAGHELRIRPINWKSIDEWKARNDEIIRSL